jgi:hypothetical protein
MVCGKPELLDGYALCDKILKCSEDACSGLMHRRLTGFTPDTGDGLVLEVALRRCQDLVLVDREEAFFDEEDPVDKFMTHRAYWCARQIQSPAVTILTLYEMLRLERSRGKTHCLFGNKIKLSLEEETSVSLGTRRLKPAMRVTLRDRMAGELENHDVFHFIVIVDNYVIDLCAARFWIFDTLERPLLIVKREDYAQKVGEGKDILLEESEEMMNRVIDTRYGAQDIASCLEQVLKQDGLSLREHGPENWREYTPSTQLDKKAAMWQVLDRMIAASLRL